MQDLKFSILIPTRERAATLGPCIETCLAQKYANLEILVSDNASSSDTRMVVDRFNDPRLKYFRQETRVSMRQNFEFLINQASGDYIIMIGDDDGVMPDAIATMAEFLSREPVDVLNWTAVVYYWPGRLIKDQGFIVFKYQKIFGTLTRIDPASRLAAFMSGKTANYIHGCNLYHGCVSRRVIDEVRSKTGQVFAGHMPDVYACAAFLFATKSIAHFDHPLSISGVSPASNGFSFFADIAATEKDGKKPTPHQVFVSEADSDPGVARPFNAQLRASQYYTASALLVANEFYGSPYEVNLDTWAKIIVDEAKAYCDLHAAKQSLDPTFELDRKIIRLVDGDASIIPGAKSPHNPAAKLSEKFNQLMIETREGGRDDVMSAFQILDKILFRRRIGRQDLVTRFLNWLDLRKRHKPYSLFKAEI